MSVVRELIDKRILPDMLTTAQIQRMVELRCGEIYTLRQVSKMCTHASLHPKKVKGETQWSFVADKKLDVIDHIKELITSGKLHGFMTTRQVEKITGINIKALWGTFKKMGVINVGKGKSIKMWRFDTNSTHDDLTSLFQIAGNRPQTSEFLLKLYNHNYSPVTLSSLVVRLVRHPEIQKHDTNPITWGLK